MDGTRMRLAALACPLALGALLGVAAVLESPTERPADASPEVGETAPATTRGPAVSASAVFGLPHTTPPPTPVEQARRALVPAPLPEPAETAAPE